MGFELAISCLALTFLNYELTYTAIVIGKGILFFLSNQWMPFKLAPVGG